MAAIIPSQTRIGNRALILLGSVERMASFDDNSPLAKQVRDLWHESRRTAIVAHPWNFAVTRRQLNEAAEKPVFGYPRQFALPEDCLRWLPPARGDEYWFAGEEEGGYILSDAAAPLAIRYIRDVEDVTRWPAHFQTFMAYQLAMDLAESATQIQTNVDDMAAKCAEALDNARLLDALATGDRRQGNVEYGSRWNMARRTPGYPRAPGR